MIVRGYDAVLDGPRPHLLIEHLEGPSLHDLLRRHGPLALEQVLPLAIHVAGALHFMAGRGYVHLDVKPDNIIMGVPPRLIDLSVARTFERAERLRGIVGTDAYMAPEQCDPELMPGRIGPPADVWGLGATLYHALAGTRPFPRPKGARRSTDGETRFPQLLGRREPLPDWRARARDADGRRDARRTSPSCGRRRPRSSTRSSPSSPGLPKRLRLAKRGTVYRWQRSLHRPGVDRLVGVHQLAVADGHLAQRVAAVEPLALVQPVERLRLPRRRRCAGSGSAAR